MDLATFRLLFVHSHHECTEDYILDTMNALILFIYLFIYLKTVENIDNTM